MLQRRKYEREQMGLLQGMENTPELMHTVKSRESAMNKPHSDHRSPW